MTEEKIDPDLVLRMVLVALTGGEGRSVTGPDSLYGALTELLDAIEGQATWSTVRRLAVVARERSLLHKGAADLLEAVLASRRT